MNQKNTSLAAGLSSTRIHSSSRAQSALALAPAVTAQGEVAVEVALLLAQELSQQLSTASSGEHPTRQHRVRLARAHGHALVELLAELALEGT